MKIMKVSHGENYFDKSSYQNFLERNLVRMHRETAAKGRSQDSQFDLFINAEKGDVLFICNSNNSIDVIGIFKDMRPLYYNEDDKNEGWVSREYVPIFKAKENTNYSKDIAKWWSPSDNSTCTLVSESDYPLFESQILEPVFHESMDSLFDERQKLLESLKIELNDIEEFQKVLSNCFSYEDTLFSLVNNLEDLELRKLEYGYVKRRNIDNKPVVKLRYELLELLLSGQKIDADVISKKKEEIVALFSKDVFHSWTSNFRILYPFLYDRLKVDIIQWFTAEIESFQRDLGISDITNYTLIDFDGAQNQGSTEVWFAIYNNSYKSQKFARQLFLKFNSSVEFGLLSHVHESINKLEKLDRYNYDQVLEVFRQYREEITSDDANIMDNIYEKVGLLDFKKQIILQGPPGTGKTREAELMATAKLGLPNTDTLKDNKQYQIVQFHPSYTYEDFVRGIVAESNGKNIEYKNVDKTISKLAKRALKSYEDTAAGKEAKPYILVIDEINRANLSSVLGELIYALEYRGSEVESMYEVDGSDKLVIPPNLYIIGTMNTADRSVGHIDYAIRRRFAFIDMLPKDLSDQGNVEFDSELFEAVKALFTTDEYITRSEFLSMEFEPKDVALGHSYFIDMSSEGGDMETRLEYEIKPILLEYVKDGVLIGDGIKSEIENLSNLLR